MNNKVIEIIIEFVKAAQDTKRNIVESDLDDGWYGICNSKYLLGQILRSYHLPRSHYLISEKAKHLWEAITDENMEHYFYRDRVYCTKENNEIIEKYTGAKKDPFYSGEIKIGQWFYYREVFHDEHIVTINDIINELISLDDVNEENVKVILDKIYICRILKSEDKKLKPKNHRSTNVEEVLNGPYKDSGIEIIRGYFK